MIINDYKCLLFEDTDVLKIKKYFVFDEDKMVISEAEPTTKLLDPCTSKEKIDCVLTYIKNEELDEKEIFELVRQILTTL